MEQIVWHKHHIIPKFDGGTDAPDNLVKVNKAMHAFLHEQRYRELGHQEDRWAAQMLRGQPDGNFWAGIGKKGGTTSGRRNTESGHCARIAKLGGHALSKEQLDAMREKSIAKLKEVITCPHCGKTGKAAGMLRWHMDNCKHSGV